MLVSLRLKKPNDKISNLILDCLDMITGLCIKYIDLTSNYNVDRAAALDQEQLRYCRSEIVYE